MSEAREINWSSQFESLIASEAERARGLAWIHMRSEQKFTFKNNIIAIPVIVLSTLAGTASVGSSSLFPEGDQKLGSIIIGLVSIGVGILNTISSYFSFSRRAEAHRIAYLAYSKLFSEIAVELSLPRHERLEPDKILSELRTNMSRLAETTPTPPQDVLDLFNVHFKDEDRSISRPFETNGLYKIKIYSDEVATPKNITLSLEDVRQTQQESKEGRSLTSNRRDSSPQRRRYSGHKNGEDIIRIQSTTEGQSTSSASGTSERVERENSSHLSIP